MMSARRNLLGDLVAFVALLCGSTVPLGPVEAAEDPACLEAPRAADDGKLRFVTYNLHSGLGDRVLPLPVPRHEVERNLRAIAAAIAAAPEKGATVDVVGLNEVDFGARRSGWTDQAAFLARELECRTGHRFEVVRGETWERRVPGLEVRFGNAALVRHPVTAAFACSLAEEDGCPEAPVTPGLPALRSSEWFHRLVHEPRGIVKVSMASPAGEADVVVTHLDPFVRPEREAQAAHVRARFVTPGRTTVVLGDMNDLPPRDEAAAPAVVHAALVTGGLADARIFFGELFPDAAAPWATFPASAPTRPLDWVVATDDLVPERLEAIGGRASDHLGLYVRYAVERP